MATLTQTERRDLVTDVCEPLQHLNRQIQFPLEMEGQPLEAVLRELERTVGEDGITYMNLRRKFFRKNRPVNSQSLTLTMPTLTNDEVGDGLPYRIDRSTYNAAVHRDWIKISPLPEYHWPDRANELVVLPDTSGGKELIKWWCAQLGMEVIQRKARVFIDVSSQEINTVGQWLRLWPGVSPFLPAQALAEAKAQKRRSQLPAGYRTGSELAAFREQAAKVEKLLAQGLMLKAAFGAEKPFAQKV